jgi:hypothetical protein
MDVGEDNRRREREEEEGVCAGVGGCVSPLVLGEQQPQQQGLAGVMKGEEEGGSVCVSVGEGVGVGVVEGGLGMQESRSPIISPEKAAARVYGSGR